MGLLACGLRWPGLFHEFWFDEVYSALWVQAEVIHPADILTSPSSDNNHPLVSLWMYLAGATSRWELYRLPSFAGGLAAVALATWFVRRFDRLTSLLAALLLAVSYPLVVYSTEARGYALMLCFGLLAAELLYRRRHPAAFCAAFVLGTLSHLTFLHFYAALLVGTPFLACREGASVAQRVKESLRWHLGPMAFFSFYGLVFLSRRNVLGAPPTPWSEFLADFLEALFGGWQWRAVNQLSWIAGIVAILWALDRVRRHHLGLFTALIAGAFLAPPALTLAGAWMKSVLLVHSRYLLPTILVSLLLLAYAIASMWKRGGYWRLAAVVQLTLVVGGHLQQDIRFLVGGRGGYKAALEGMASGADGGRKTLSAASVFRVSALLSYYVPLLGMEMDFRPETPAGATADWHILETLRPEGRVPERFVADSGAVYKLYSDHSYYGPSGQRWTLYRRQEGP
ncbi:MAG: hypothetical protein FJW20_09000 [Acidimicrobiia bacterium]|nr:hypothetical protein [Acidimicrobiia bacterium]